MMLHSIVTMLRSSKFEAKHVCEVLSSTVSDNILRGLRTELSADSKRRQDIVNQSYKHPNGFDRFVLHKQAEFTLRMHIWWPANKVGKEHIHTHRWNYCSRLLLGQYDFEVYAMHENGDRFYCHVDAPAKDKVGVYSHTLIGEQTLKISSSGTLSQDSCYFQIASIPHRIIYRSKSPTVTLFVHGKVMSEKSLVYTSTPLSDLDNPVYSNMDNLMSEEYLLHALSELERWL